MICLYIQVIIIYIKLSKLMKKESNILDLAQEYAQRVIKGLNESVTAFHAVNYISQNLKEKGFTELFER